MAKLTWDQEGQKYYETGVDKGVLFPATAEDGGYASGVAWNGLININESPSGAEPTALYANNKKYGELLSAEEFAGTIEAYTYPDEYAPCLGYKEIAPGVYATQQARKAFGFSYRSLIGNDTEGTSHGYKLHIVYGAKAKPSEKANNSINDSPEAATLSWEFSTTPVELTNGEPTAHLIFDSRTADETKLKSLEDLLYGTESVESKLPTPDEIIALMGDGKTEPAAG